MSTATDTDTEEKEKVENQRGLETPDNVGSDTATPEELMGAPPSRFEYMEREILDQFRRIYATDPEGVTRVMAVVVSDDGGKSFRIEADSTEHDRFVGTPLWSKEFVESEVTKATVPVAKTGSVP